MIEKSLRSFVKVTGLVFLISSFSTLFYYSIGVAFQNEPNVTVETDAFLISFIGLTILGLLLNTAALIFNIIESIQKNSQ